MRRCTVGGSGTPSPSPPTTVDLDILGTPAGISGFDDLEAHAQAVKLADGLIVRVASLEDLIRMKRAAGRPKDRIELEILGALRDELDGPRVHGRTTLMRRL